MSAKTLLSINYACAGVNVFSLILGNTSIIVLLALMFNVIYIYNYSDK